MKFKLLLILLLLPALAFGIEGNIIIDNSIQPVIVIDNSFPNNLVIDPGIIELIFGFLEQFVTIDWWEIEFGISKTFNTPRWDVDDWVGSINGVSLAQTTGSEQPQWIVDQLSGFPAIVFNGSDEYLVTSAFSSPLSQPNTIILVAKNPTVNVNALYDGIAINKRHNIIWDNTPKYVFRASTAQDVLSITPTVGWAIITAVFDEAASFLRDNGNQGGVSGTIGNDDLTGFVLGANRVFASHANISVTDVIIIDGGLTAAQAGQLETLLNRLRGVY